jgi:hypothetical protein
MHEHRKQSDGELRDGDNWQKGIPRDQYMKSGFRHFVDWWLAHRAGEFDPDPENLPNDEELDVLCALLFNVMGYMYEVLRGR